MNFPEESADADNPAGRREREKLRQQLSINSGRRVLIALTAAGELSARELAGRLEIGAPTVRWVLLRAELVGLVTRTCGRLSPGWLERETPAQRARGIGPRRNRWRITEEGATFAHQLQVGEQ